MEIFQAITNRYPHLKQLRVRNIEANQTSKLISCIISYPDILQIDQSMRNDIATIVADISPSKYKVSISYINDRFTCDSFANYLVDFIKKKHIILSDIKKNNIVVSSNDDKMFEVTFYINNLQKLLAEQCNFTSDFLQTLARYSSCACKISYSVTQLDDKDIQDIVDKQAKLAQLSDSKFVNKPSRFVSIIDKKKVLGGIITSTPRYIVDIASDSGNCVVCGSLSNKSYSASKKNPNLMVLKFDLTDLSATISVVMFVRHRETVVDNIKSNSGKSDTDCKAIALKNLSYNDNIDKRITLLYTNDSVAVMGKITLDEYYGKLMIVGYSLNRCCVVKANEKITYHQHPKSEYNVINPKKISDISNQLSLFESKSQLPSLIREQDIVVLECNLTGKNIIKDNILGISCYKLSCGLIVSKLETYINPEKKLSDKLLFDISIPIEQLIYYPTMTEVIGDIYKFCFNCKLVGNNISNTVEFLQYYATPMNYLLDMEQIDFMDTISSLIKYMQRDIKLTTFDDILKFCKLSIDNTDCTHICFVNAQCLQTIIKSM